MNRLARILRWKLCNRMLSVANGYALMHVLVGLALLTQPVRTGTAQYLVDFFGGHGPGVLGIVALVFGSGLAFRCVSKVELFVLCAPMAFYGMVVLVHTLLFGGPWTPVLAWGGYGIILFMYAAETPNGWLSS